MNISLNKQGFTLVELSIVLVIIGLIVGSVLVGKDLISAAEIRAQISQIEKYHTAVRTFRLKYGALPGDMDAATANAFGFAPRGSNPGQGDGNGSIDPGAGPGGSGITNNSGYSMAYGETAMFWVDLSKANLIDGSFTTATSATNPGDITTTQIPLYLPAAKLGAGNYVYVSDIEGMNYYGIQKATFIYSGYGVEGAPGLTVMQAYNIDTKIDDGVPVAGKVGAVRFGSGQYLFVGGGGVIYTPAGSLLSGITSYYSGTANPATCIEQNASGAMVYATEFNGGNGVNCALIFRFQ